MTLYQPASAAFLQLWAMVIYSTLAIVQLYASCHNVTVIWYLQYLCNLVSLKSGHCSRLSTVCFKKPTCIYGYTIDTHIRCNAMIAFRWCVDNPIIVITASTSAATVTPAADASVSNGVYVPGGIANGDVKPAVSTTPLADFLMQLEDYTPTVSPMCLVTMLYDAVIIIY